MGPDRRMDSCAHPSPSRAQGEAAAPALRGLTPAPGAHVRWGRCGASLPGSGCTARGSRSSGCQRRQFRHIVTAQPRRLGGEDPFTRPVLSRRPCRAQGASRALDSTAQGKEGPGIPVGQLWDTPPSQRRYPDEPEENSVTF